MSFVKKVSIVATLSVAVLTAPAEAAIVFSDGFETETVNNVLDRWASYETWGSRSSHSLSTSLAREGSRSMRFCMDKSAAPVDPPKADLVDRGQDQVDGINLDEENWIGFSFYVPTSHVFGDSRPTILYQMHDNNKRPPFTLTISDNGYLQYSFSADDNQTATDQLAPITKGKWMDIVLHTKPSYSSNGFMKIYVNGELEKTYNGKFSEPGASLRASRIGWYLSGLRRSESINKYAGEDYVIYFDAYRRGDKNSSYEEVAPR